MLGIKRADFVKTRKVYGLPIAPIVLLCTAKAVRITIEEFYNGKQYGVMIAAMAEYLKDGRSAEYDEQM